MNGFEDNKALKPWDEFHNNNFDMETNIPMQNDRGYFPEAGEPKPNTNLGDSLVVDEQDIARAATLDEPIITTLRRDMRMIARKVKQVLVPKTTEERNQSLKDWDLWGPLIFCLALGILLSLDSPTNSGDLIFGIVFMIFWAGSGLVTLNARLLRGTTTFFQSMCLLGYCLFPLVVSAFIISILSGILDGWVRLLIVLPGLGYSIYASSGFLGFTVPPEKRIISVYPAGLLYLFIGWLIMIA
eukprot:TRINITY_DN4518_c0_g2_i1.p1 TRINITY_DN4518_c0_g2~~TRINITY_DN4518_c0_g2_i1.p1  ORF type:complete len:242 (+),score=40.56 TRINITY_DN4518_c0_g2_i1:233-958(+)